MEVKRKAVAEIALVDVKWKLLSMLTSGVASTTHRSISLYSISLLRLGSR